MSINSDLYKNLEYAYNFLNVSLFDGRLPGAVFAIAENSMGHVAQFIPNAFGIKNTHRKIDLITLSPGLINDSSELNILGSLCHEACHQAGFDLGSTGHDRIWASIMKSIGMLPSRNGITEAIGDDLGHDNMNHIYIYDSQNGLFLERANRLINNGWSLNIL